MLGQWMGKKRKHVFGLRDQSRGQKRKKDDFALRKFCCKVCSGRCAKFPCSHHQHGTHPLYPVRAGSWFKITVACFFGPSPGGSISQDSEKANRNIPHLFKPAPLFQSLPRSNGFPQPLRNQAYHFLMGSWRDGGGCQCGLFIEQCQRQKKRGRRDHLEWATR